MQEKRHLGVKSEKKSYNEKPKVVLLVFWDPVAALHSFHGFLRTLQQ